MKKIPLNIIGTSAKVSSKKYCDKLDCDTKPFGSKLCFLDSHSMLPLLLLFILSTFQRVATAFETS
jgi:hypothetical protein